MSKRKVDDLENSRKSVAELITKFISSAELYEMSIETEYGGLSLRKYESQNKIGFKPNGDKQ